MTSKEALAFLKDIVLPKVPYRMNGKSTLLMNEWEAFNIIEKDLDKLTKFSTEIELSKPKKPMFIEEESYSYINYKVLKGLCPRCGNNVRNKDAYCNCCGGKLDWSLEEKPNSIKR